MKMKNAFINAHNLDTHYYVSLTDCKRMCTKDNKCVSFDFNYEACYLSEYRYAEVDGEDQGESPDYDYYEKQDTINNS